MIDLIPDCIGYALILYALRHVSSFAPYMQEASDGFKKLFYVSLFKLPALFIMISMATQRITITLFSLSFAIIELFFLIPAIGALFEGLYYLGSRFGCEAALRETPKKPDAIRFMTLLFLVIKHALSTLPDFLFLFEYDPLTGEGFTVTNAQYILVLILAFIITLIFSIVWLSHILPYLRGISKDEGTRALRSPEGVDLSHREGVRFRLALPYVLFGAALCFSVDFVVDKKNLLPDYLAAACFLVLSLYLFFRAKGNASESSLTKKSDFYASLPILSSSLYLIATVLHSVYRTRFYASFTESDLTSYSGLQASYVPANQEALAAYLPVNITSVIAEFLFIICVMLALHALHRFSKENTKTAPPRSAVEERFLSEEKAEDRKHSIICFVLTCISAVASALHLFLLRFNSKTEMQPGYGSTALYLPKSGAFWLFVLAVSILLAVYGVWLVRTRIRRLFKENGIEIERYSSFD